jgi:hypothetical protein
VPAQAAVAAVVRHSTFPRKMRQAGSLHWSATHARRFCTLPARRRFLRVGYSFTHKNALTADCGRLTARSETIRLAERANRKYCNEDLSVHRVGAHPVIPALHLPLWGGGSWGQTIELQIYPYASIIYSLEHPLLDQSGARVPLCLESDVRGVF